MTATGRIQLVALTPWEQQRLTALRRLGLGPLECAAHLDLPYPAVWRYWRQQEVPDASV